MKRPNKSDYDFNDVFEAVSFGANMIKYADYIESKALILDNKKIKLCDKCGTPKLAGFNACYSSTCIDMTHVTKFKITIE